MRNQLLRGLAASWFVTLLAIVGMAGCGPGAPTPAGQAGVKGSAPAHDETSSEGGTARPGGSESAIAASQESWDVFFLGADRIGHGVTRRGPAPENPDLVRTVATVKLSIRRFGEATESSMTYASIETADAQVRQARGEADLGGGAMTFEGQVVDNVLQTKTTTAGKTVRGSIPWSADCRGFFAIEDSLRRHPMQPGQRRKLRMLLPVFNQLVDVELQAGDWETTDLLDGSQKLLRIESTTMLPDNQKNVDTLWTDERGELVKSSNPAMQQTIYRTTREIALQERTGAPLDVGQLTLVKIPKPIDNPHAKTQLRYRVRLEDSDPSKAFAADASQQVTPIDGNTAEIVVRAIRPGAPADGGPIAEASQAARPEEGDLQPNSFIQSDDPRIVKLAREAAGEETDPWRTVVALERFVYEKIDKKNFSQTLATAADVAETLSGDCTEHAVLLAALARARGIPSRVALGLVYAPSEQAFGFHMWTEVYIGDRWIGVDGTLGQGGLGAGHLKLSASNMKEGAAMSSFLPVAQVLGRLKIVDISEK